MVNPKPKILLIDEDSADRPLAAVVLSSAFSRPVCEVGNGKNFIAGLKDGAYDAVVTELGIEGVSPTFQLEAIRAIQPAAPIVVFTKTDDPDIRRQAIEAGAAAFVRKSNQGFLDLAGAVQGALDTADRAPEAAQAEEAATTRQPPFALDPLPPRDPGVSEAPAWVRRLSPMVSSIRASLAHGLGRGVAIFLGVVAVSAILSALFGTFGRDDAAAQNGGDAVGIVASAAVGGDEEPSTSDADVEEPVAAVTEPASTPRPQSEKALEPRPAARAAPVTLELLARDSVWILVSVDGVTALDAIMEAGQRRSFAAQKHIELRVGNAAGLTVLWNGDDIGSLGRPDQVRRLYFTPTRVGVGPAPSD